ncbi:polyhydroxyalkanoate synthesis repressor PhaR [Algiphilus sp.]|uniref:polyhydroxyalkanoate synthesis repressor PhaR n=1 Tax=Algiphilus sp. TaxID=1872431 RepID=UPI001CA70ABF|nr:polyhydroxyalkanoate synthesis repressor PhaR [Algiphilus sp.]MBY8966816.1 polyhydroxyalkanoate synthesis repressor PhaR [Algiphilus acroporae]MCI5061441.1 polyhydroxyalkanoate synthesis repressor PhaR [Algiphilus sp.]MCI5104013.1 polyhydroxyalkanoate synthesis repressor PhaR [Algiphilus sp.]
MSEARIIKKYPNRRLYDTAISRYITLEEVRQLVLDNRSFQVIDKRTHEDITRSILLQVISEQEQGGDPIFQTDLLKHIIRFYGDPMQGTISRYLELSMQMFLEKQQQFADQLRGMLGRAEQPFYQLRELAEEHVPIWRTVRREFLKNLGRENEEKLLPKSNGKREQSEG